jgi:hypothetical protein
MAPISMVAKPKDDGTGQLAPSEVSGTAPKAAPSAAPTTTEPRTNAAALSYSRSAKASMMVGS